MNCENSGITSVNTSTMKKLSYNISVKVWDGMVSSWWSKTIPVDDRGDIVDDKGLLEHGTPRVGNKSCNVRN